MCVNTDLGVPKNGERIAEGMGANNFKGNKRFMGKDFCS